MEEPPFICPHCEHELHLPDNVWYYTCEYCGNRLDLKSQFAFLRGLDAFSEGQDIMMNINPRKRRIFVNSQDKKAMNLFMEAYSSLQVAFQASLPESQRGLGIEMMTSMSQEFMKRGMVSSLEVNYWNSLMVEQTAQKEYIKIKQNLDDLAGTIWNSLKRWRWRNRNKQLVKTLAQLDEKIRTLEKQIDFVDIPQARNNKWKL